MREVIALWKRMILKVGPPQLLAARLGCLGTLAAPAPNLPGGAGQTLAPVIGDGTIKSVAAPLTASSRFYQVVAR
jgi:hypothetical protein